MTILAIDTSCDETAAAITKETKVMSNVIWSQASLHAKFGGIVPSLAQRHHEEKIDWVISRAIKKARTGFNKINAIAVTVGPGLAIALEVGIRKAKEISSKHDLPIIPVNHVEAHLFSPLAISSSLQQDAKPSTLKFPVYGLVVSGGNTLFVLARKFGEYEILAKTSDDALGEALDKGARMLGLGYPGGAVLERFARQGNPLAYKLPIPLSGQEKRMVFSYSGLKTALYRLISKQKEENLDKKIICDLAASYQYTAFQHIYRVIDFYLSSLPEPDASKLFIGGGVAANLEFRKTIRGLCKKHKIKAFFPYSKKLYTDNAAMVGVCAFLREKHLGNSYVNQGLIDRVPNLQLP